MVVLRTRAVTPQTLAKDSTPSGDRQSPAVHQPEAPVPVSPSSTPLSAPRRSGRLASRSPTAYETPQTTGRKRRRASGGVGSIAENKAIEEGKSAAQGVANEGNVIADRIEPEAEEETPQTTERRRSASAGVGSIAKNKAIEEGKPAVMGVADGGNVIADRIEQEAEEETPQITGCSRGSASAGVGAIAENKAIEEGNPAAEGVADGGNVIADRVEQEVVEETPPTTGRKRGSASACVGSIADNKATEEGDQAVEDVATVITERVKLEERENDGKCLSLDENRSVKRIRRWTSEEKGKGKLGEVGSLETAIGGKGISIENDVKNGELRVPGTLIINEGGAECEGRRNRNQSSTGVTGKVSREEQERLNEEGKELESKIEFLKSEFKRTMDALSKKLESGSRMVQFKDAARKNAARFAHFEAQENQQHQEAPPGVQAGWQSTEGEQKVEDWPGPFSTAMKIIRDRSNRMNLQSGKPTSDKPNSFAINWTPREDGGGCNRSKKMVPSLQQLCTEGLAKYADAITSLECVPDAFRHRLSQLLCDSRKMNTNFLNLIACGSPSEIRIRDCSWLTEEEFTDCVQGLDTSNLTVLQLDYSGRGMPDYVLLATLAGSPSSLPVLNTLSLNGAYRLSDVGIRALVSAAPSLRCLNLSQCSLVSATSISILVDSLGSTLQELYLNDCQSIDAMLMLPALLRFEQLEVLSVGGIETVSDDFIICFVSVCGHAMKELVLSDCVKLTDSSLKVIASACPCLQSLNLANVRQLTDSALGYLANGCQEIQTLKLCRNNFSDEAVAAFIEASGESLKDLSLNSVKQVSHNTALSVARRARNLQSLDLSWCRNLADEAVGLIVDSCLSLKVLKIFGCDQLTDVLLSGHSNPVVEIIGMKMSPALANVRVSDAQAFPAHYASVLSSM
ncbi:unnamed protein product [Linum trigynum]|uniref:F-box/LRR-repeat protein 15-like leucin rich repeat domain-containing protein n=1 Tax=Linum trigynum TaxID=586398 RepID=A0AAV2GT90_9ROSI